MSKPKPAGKPVSTLAVNPRNPNRMADEDKGRMAKSLAEFGDLSGIVFNRKTRQLIGGHQRTSVMQTGQVVITERLSKPERDGTVARGYVEHLGARYQYREVDWPEARANAAMLAANRFGRVGEDDPGILKDVLLELDTGEFDIDLTGFDERAMEDLMTQFHVDGDPEKEWQGMPEFGDAVQAAKSIHVHFKKLEDVESFSKLIGQKISEKTSYIWHPERKKEAGSLSFESDGEK